VSLLRTLARRHAWLAALLLVMAMGARAAVPQGWMPEARADGSLALVQCNGSLPAQATMGPMHHHHGMHGGATDHAAHHPEQPCGFAGMVGPLLPHATMADVPVRHASPQEFAVAAPVLPDLAAHPVRPPSRGPPALV